MQIFYSNDFNSKKEFNFVKNCFSGEIRFLNRGQVFNSDEDTIQKLKPVYLTPIKGGGYLVFKNKGTNVS